MNGRNLIPLFILPLLAGCLSSAPKAPTGETLAEAVGLALAL